MYIYRKDGKTVHLYNYTNHPVRLLAPNEGFIQIDPEGQSIRINMIVESVELGVLCPVALLSERTGTFTLPTGLKTPAIVIVSRVVLRAMRETGDWREQLDAGVLYVAPTRYLRDDLGRVTAASALTIS